MTRDDRFVSLAIGDVMRSFDADPVASVAALRPLIDHASLEQHGYNDAPAIARGLSSAHAASPGFVRDVYSAVFAIEERSDEKVDITGSRIFGFVSNRRQDFNHAKWQLGQDFAAFLEASTIEASQAMAAVLNTYSATHVRSHRDRRSSNVVFRGETYSYEQDLSASWERESLNQHDPEHVILSAWFDHLPALMRESADLFYRSVETAAAESRYANFWRRLIIAGVREPETIGILLAPLLTQVPVLAGIDTTEASGKLIAAVWLMLTESIRSEVVETLTAVQPDILRVRLLGCIPREGRSERVIAMLPAEEEIPENEIFPPFRSSVSTFTREEFLREQGVDPDKPANKLARDVAAELEAATITLKTKGGSAKTLRQVFTKMRKVLEVLTSPNIDVEQTTFGWNAIAEACDVVTRQEALDSPQRRELVKALAAVLEIKGQDWDSNFDEHGSWGGPAPLVPAATALMKIARGHWNASIERLVRKASKLKFRPARAQVAGSLGMLGKTAPDEMWKLAREFAAKDKSPRVVSYLLHSLPWLMSRNAAKARPLLDTVYSRINDEMPGGADVTKICRDLYVDRFLMNPEDLRAAEVVREIVGSRNEKTEYFRSLCFRLRVHLDQCVKSADVTSLRYRRAVGFFGELAKLLADDRVDLESIADARASDDANVAQIRAVFTNQKELASEFRFTIGRDRFGHSLPRASNPQQEAIEERYRAAQGELVKALLPSVLLLANGASPATAHSLLEGLESYVDDMPNEIFPVIASIVRGAREYGFQLEYMAAELVVKIIERYMTRYPEIIESSDDRRRELVECLDSFATWPSALQLVYRFDDVFR